MTSLYLLSFVIDELDDPSEYCIMLIFNIFSPIFFILIIILLCKDRTERNKFFYGIKKLNPIRWIKNLSLFILHTIKILLFKSEWEENEEEEDDNIREIVRNIQLLSLINNSYFAKRFRKVI